MTFGITFGPGGGGTPPPPTGPRLAASPTSWGAGSVGITAGAVTQLLTVTNTGDQNVVIAGAGPVITGSGFSGSSNTISGSIPPGANRTILLSFDPSVVGAVTGACTINSNSVLGALVVPLAGTGFSGSADPAWMATTKAKFAGITYTDFTASNSIPHTGSTDSTSAMQAFIDATPDGAGPTAWSRILIPAGWTLLWTGDFGMQFRDRKYLQIEGVGSTRPLLLQHTTGVSNNSAMFFCGRSSGTPTHHMQFVNLRVQGEATNMGTSSAWSDIRERDHGLHCRASTHTIGMDNVYLTQERGWPIYYNLDDGGSFVADTWVRNCVIEGGETGLAVMAVDRMIVEDSTIDKAALFLIDFEPEPDGGGQGFRDAMMQRLQLGTYGWDAPYTSWMCAMNPNPAALGNSVMDRFTLRDCTIFGGDQQTAGRGGLTMRFDKANIKRDVVITGNVSSIPRTSSSYPPIQLNALVNAQINGNTQIVPGHGPLVVHAPDATDVPDTGTISYTPNVT